MTSPSPCRWGILSTATIARKNWQAIRDAGNASLVAVASRDAEKARRFVEECHAQVPQPRKPEALGSYEALLQRPDVDAVYIPLPTGLRKEWVIRAAEAGKHVLVEKPVAVCAADFREMMEACRQKGVQLMDGTMFMHSRRLQRLREVLDDPDMIGDIQRLVLHFSFPGGEEFMRQDIRTKTALEPMGCLGDLGWYCIRFALWAMEFATPNLVSAHAQSRAMEGRKATGVPVTASGRLFFGYNGRESDAMFHCSFDSSNAQWAVINGTKGSLYVSDFVLPFSGATTGFTVRKPEFVLNGCQFDMREGQLEERIDEPSNNAPGSQEAEMFRTFSSLVLDGKIDDRWSSISLKTQEVLDACIESCNKHGSAIPLMGK
jgi:predicted dehydrogenase